MSDKIEELKKRMYSTGGPKERRRKEFSEEVKSKSSKKKTYWSDEADTGIGAFSAETKESLKPIVGEGELEKGDAANGIKRAWSLRTKIFIGVIALSAGLLITAAISIYLSIAPSGQAVDLVINSGHYSAAGGVVEWEIVFRNTDTVVIKDVDVTFVYPPGSIPEEDGAKNTLRSRASLGTVEPGQIRRQRFSARLFGTADEEKTAEAIVVYQPENVSSRLVERKTFTTIISQVPLAVSFTMPEQVVSGQDLEVVVDVTSSSQAGFQNISMRIDFPFGFQFHSSDVPSDFENNIWYFGDLQGGESRRITLQGNILGLPEEIKPFRVTLGEYNSETRQWKTFLEKAGETRIAPSFLFVRQELVRQEEDIVKFGEVLTFNVRYKNNLPVTVRDVSIRVRLSEEFFDMRSLKTNDGFFDGQSREIIWNAASVPGLKELDAGEGGMVFFSISAIKQPPITKSSDKEFVAVSVANINTQTVPRGFEGVKLEYEDILTMKFQTELSFGAKAIFYNSPLGANIGSLPPRIGRQTGYTVLFEISNISNDLKNALFLKSSGKRDKYLTTSISKLWTQTDGIKGP